MSNGGAEWLCGQRKELFSPGEARPPKVLQHMSTPQENHPLNKLPLGSIPDLNRSGVDFMKEKAIKPFLSGSVSSHAFKVGEGMTEGHRTWWA